MDAIGWCCSSPRARQVNIERGGQVGLFDRERIPTVLEDFLNARQQGNAAGAASFCSDDVVMKGPMGKFEGIDAVKEKAFTLAAHPPKKMFMLLQYQPQHSTPEAAAYAREFEVSIGTETVPLRQEFVVRSPGSATAKVCSIEFQRLPPDHAKTSVIM